MGVHYLTGGGRKKQNKVFTGNPFNSGDFSKFLKGAGGMLAQVKSVRDKTQHSIHSRQTSPQCQRGKEVHFF